MGNKCLSVLVIDGMGGGIGKSIVEKLVSEDIKVQIIAAGTNPVAMNRMLAAGATAGMTDEKIILDQMDKVDIIVGAMGILIPNGLAGEISQEMVLATCASDAIKILIPMDRCGIRIATEQKSITHYIHQAVQQIKNYVDQCK